MAHRRQLQKIGEAKLSRDIERNKMETIFFMIKRIRGEVSELQDERERDVAQGAYRMCSIFLMISTKPPAITESTMSCSDSFHS